MNLSKSSHGKKKLGLEGICRNLYSLNFLLLAAQVSCYRRNGT